MFAKTPQVEIAKGEPGYVVYQLGGPSRAGLYSCLSRAEAEAFVVGMRAATGPEAYAAGYATGAHDMRQRLAAKLEAIIKEQP